MFFLSAYVKVYLLVVAALYNVMVRMEKLWYIRVLLRALVGNNLSRPQNSVDGFFFLICLSFLFIF